MKLNNVDLNKVAVFCQIIDSGGYRDAAEKLNVTPSALSQTIAHLEHSVGVPLFRRVGRRLQPTASGLLLHKEFSHHHAGFLRAVGRIADRQDQVVGLLRVGAYLEFAKTQLAPAVADFLRHYPGVQVKFVFDTPTRLHRLLEAGQIDLCFSIYPSTQTKAILSQPMYQEELVLIAPRDLLPESPGYDQLVQQPIVDYYFNHQPIRRWLKLHFPRKNPKRLEVRTFAATAEMVLALVKQGVGIGVVPRYLLTQKDLSEKLTVVRPTERRFMDHIWILQQKDQTGEISKVTEAFRAQVLERADR